MEERQTDTDIWQIDSGTDREGKKRRRKRTREMKTNSRMEMSGTVNLF